MKRKILLSTILAALAATGARAQVVNFHDDKNGNWNAITVPLLPSLTGGMDGPTYYQSYLELFAGQAAYEDPGNNIWNGFGKTGGFLGQVPIFYSAPPGYGGYLPTSYNVWPQQFGNPGNPYAAYSYTSYTYGTYSTGWISATGPSPFVAYLGNSTTQGNSDSSGNWTPVTLSVGNGIITNYTSDYMSAHTKDSIKSPVQNGSPAFLLESSAQQATNAANPWGTNVFVLGNVPFTSTNTVITTNGIVVTTNYVVTTNTYGLYLYGANYGNKAATLFSLNSGNAHFGVAGTTNSGASGVPTTFAEGTDFVIWENVTPDTNGDITITAQANPAARLTGATDTPGFSDVNGFQLIFNPPPTAVNCTYAQNVYAGKTASFSFSPAFTTNATYPTASFQWQSIIGGVTNALTNNGATISGATTTNLVLTNVVATNAGLYQCVLSSGLGTNVSPLIPLTILTSLYTNILTTTASSVADFGNMSTPYAMPYNAIPPTFFMTDAEAIDGTLYQYVNFGSNGTVAPFQGPVGLTFTPTAGSTIVNGMRIFTASRRPEDDPRDYYLYGSTNSGKTYNFISGGPLALPAQRNAAAGAINVTNQVLQEIDFTNIIAYDSYQLVFSNVVSNALASNGVQFAEVQLLGTNGALAPGITGQPATNVILLVGQTLTNSVKAIGTATIHYQWFFDSKAIASATASLLTVTNLQLSNSGSYYCVVTNGYTNLSGPLASTSTVLNLTVVATNVYQSALSALKPLAYWPLNETNGTTAYEYIHGMNGTYEGSVTLGQPGVPFAGFGSNNFGALFDGATAYVDIPVGYLNSRSAITLSAWVKSYGSNGFLTDIMGHGAASYSLAETPNGDAAFFDDGGGCTNPISITDGNWHQVVGVRNNAAGVTNNYIYVDGFLFTSNGTTTGNLPSTASDVWIAGTPDLTAGLFAGEICNVAIIPSALTAAQVEAFYSADEGPPTVVVPTNVTVDQNGNVAITATGSGPTPYFYQWYYVQGTSTNLISGATNNPLQLISVQPIQSNYLYYVVISNAYGANTSSFATVTILTGPPVIVTDVPTNVFVAAGTPVTLATAFVGTLPYSFQWTYNGQPLSSGPRISGVTSNVLTINPTIVGDTGTYQLLVTNADGTAQSSQAALTVVPYVGFTNLDPLWTLGGTMQGSFIGTNLLEVTTGDTDEVFTAFFDYPLYTASFQATFTYVDGAGGGGADGMTICVQNDPRGLAAIGSDGGALGYSNTVAGLNILNSVALEFRTYGGDPNGIAIGRNGSIGTSITNTGGVNITNGDPINVTVNYTTGVLSVVLQDAITSNRFALTTNVTLPTLVESNFAYFGFTGGTGAADGVETVSNFQYAVDYPPVFVVVPTNVTVIAGGAPGTFTSSATGTALGGYQWQLNGANLTNGPSPSGTGATISGSLTSALTISGATIADNAETYTVVVTNAFGTNSASAILTVIVSPPTFLGDITVIGTNVIFNYSTVAGLNYQIQSTTNLAKGPWTAVGGLVTGTGSPAFSTNGIGTNAQKYFRLEIEP
jgi:hypothetical protein